MQPSTWLKKNCSLPSQNLNGGVCLHLTVSFSATAECEKLHQHSAREAINPEDLRGQSDAGHRGDTW